MSADTPCSWLGFERSKRPCPPHRVTLDPFLIDATEVTNAQLAAFLNTLAVTARRDVRAGELRPDDVEGPDADRLWGGSSGNDRAFIEMDDTDARIGIVNGRLAPEPGFADHPRMQSHSALGAAPACRPRSSGKRPHGARRGEHIPGVRPRHLPSTLSSGGGVGTDPVGSHPKGATPEGVFDLSGNEAKWTSSLFQPYPYDAAEGREDTGALGQRVTRGGNHGIVVAPGQLTAACRVRVRGTPSGLGRGDTGEDVLGPVRTATSPLLLPDAPVALHGHGISHTIQRRICWAYPPGTRI